MLAQHRIQCHSSGRGFHELTERLEEIVAGTGIKTGTCNLFCEHTSASLVLCENADSDVLHDLERFMSRLVADGDPLFRHTAEGDDDMPAHIRSALTTNSITMPICNGMLHSGKWQGVYLWEHRTGSGRARNLLLTLAGE